MSVYDNKLINYGNLAEFHNQILNDTGVTTVSTWSSYKLDGELASKQDTLVAGDGIQISGNTISATGGGGSSDAIEDVSVLPNASANKNKFVRLASDKKVYVSECSTSTEEVNAPDAQQIDNAHIIYAVTEQAGGGLISDLVYTGQIYTIVDGDGNESQCYWWKDVTNLSDSDTSITQSNITTMDATWIFTKVNAENCNLTDNIIIFYVESGEYGISLSGSTITFNGDIVPGYAESINQINEELQPDSELVLQLVKQTVTIENWDWLTLNTSIQPITYAELKALRDNKQLVPGQQYRITDYVTTTALATTQIAAHQFDIIVTADAEDKLNENARAIQHEFDTSSGTTYYKWVYDNTGESWLLSDASSYTNQVAGTCDISPMDGYDYYTTSYPIVGTIDENGDEPYMPGGLYRKAILYTEGDDLYYGDYIDEEKWNSWEESKQEDNPSYTPQPYPEWFIGKYFLDENDTFTYDGTYTEGIDTHFNKSKLESWELKYCLDNDTNRFSWAQNVGAAIQIRSTSQPVTMIYKRVPSGDNQSGYAWYYVLDSDNKSFDEITNWNVNYYDSLRTDSEVPAIGTSIWGGGYVVSEYSSDAVPSGKGVIYYMKDEFNNQVYFDFKNILILDGDSEEYGYLFGKNDSDYSLNGSANNNIIEGEITDGVLSIDTSLMFWDVVGYQNIVEVPEYTAGNSVIRINNNSIYGSTINSISNGGIICNYDNANNIYSISVDYDYFVPYIFGVINQKQEYNSLPNNEKYLTIKALENNTNVTYTGTKTIEYSLDLINWKSININKTIALLTIGSEVYIRGNNSNYDSCKIQTDKKSKYYGNIMSLINSEDFKNLTILESGNAFHGLFYGSKVQDASELLLPATTLTNRCYQGMFSHCTELTSVPELPATTLADYCYEDMFYGCTSLTTAPELPATTLTQWCYGDMFNGCTNLNYVKCLGTSVSAHRCTRSWLNGVSSTGTFITPSSTNWSTGVDGIPSNWTRVDSDTVSNA